MIGNTEKVQGPVDLHFGVDGFVVNRDTASEAIGLVRRDVGVLDTECVERKIRMQVQVTPIEIHLRAGNGRKCGRRQTDRTGGSAASMPAEKPAA